MNYIKELNAFYDWLESNPCPSDAIALWHALLAICNKAGWPKEFTVANATLQAKAGLSRQKLDRWRGFLKSKGLIDYKKSDRVNQAGKYSIIPFCPIVQNETQNDTQDDTRNETQNETQDDTQNGAQNEHINKTKQNKTKNPPNSPQVKKIQYAEYVLLTEAEYEKLVNEHGEDAVKEMIEILNSYKASTGKKYKSDYHTMTGRGWVLDRFRKEQQHNLTDPDEVKRRRVKAVMESQNKTYAPREDLELWSS